MNRLTGWLIIPIFVGLTITSGSAQAATAPAVEDDTVAYVETQVFEDIYATEGGTLQRTVASPTKIAGYAEVPDFSSQDAMAETTTPTLNAVVKHDTTGCHKIRMSVTGYSEIVGTVLWRYWVSTYSCWNKLKRLVYAVDNGAKFTIVTSTVGVTHNLLKYARYFYNPAGLFDPFPLPGLNSHSAYYNWSKGEATGTCGIITQVACWFRPSVTIKSLYSGNWWAKASNGAVHSG